MYLCQAIALAAARKVKVVYRSLPAIFTIEEAIAAGSYLHEREQHRGDAEAGFVQSDHVLEGEMRIGGLSHIVTK